MDIQALNDCEGKSIAVVDEVKILVRAEVDAAIKALDKAEKKSDSLWDSFKNLQTVMQGPVAAAKDVYSAFSKLVAVGTDLYNEFASAELAAIKLNAAISNSSNMSAGAGDRLAQFADSLQSISVFEGDATKAIIGNLAAMGRSESQIKDLVTAASNLASATGQDLESAVAQLNGTLNGNVGLLGRQNGAIKNLTEEQLKNGDAIKVINEQYKGFNEKIAKSASGAVDQLSNSFGDLKETIGQTVAISFAPMIESLNQAVKNTNLVLQGAQAQQKLVSGQKLGYQELVTLEEYLTKEIKDGNGQYNIRATIAQQQLSKVQDMLLMSEHTQMSDAILLDLKEKQTKKEEELGKKAKVSGDISAERAKKQVWYEAQRGELINKRQRAQMDEDAIVESIADNLESAVPNMEAFALEWKNLLGITGESSVEMDDIEETIEAIANDVSQVNRAWSDWNFQIGDTTIEADKLAEALSEVWNSATNTAGAYFDLVNNENAIEMQENKEKNDAYIKMLEDEADKYEDGSDQKKDADKEIALEKERIAQEEKDVKNKYGKQAFENEKTLALAQIAINGAVAAMKAYAELGPALGIPAAIAIGGLAITQGALVAGKNYVPMAQGGIVTSPTRTLIGENGPEAIIPLRGDNKNIAMGGGGVTIIQNIGGSVVTEKYLTGQAMKAVALANRGY